MNAEHDGAFARLAVYAGSFDPPTLGHLDLIERASALFSHVIVGIGKHATRSPLFAVSERVDLVQQISAHLPNVRVEAFDGLLIEYCRRIGARVIVRGLRAATFSNPSSRSRTRTRTSIRTSTRFSFRREREMDLPARRSFAR